MAKTGTTPTRITDDLVAAAAAVGAAEQRSGTEQVNRWARIGKEVERSASAAGRRVLEVAAGRAQFVTLDRDERTAAHGMVDAAISARVATERFGDPEADVPPVRSVMVNDDGTISDIATV